MPQDNCLTSRATLHDDHGRTPSTITNDREGTNSAAPPRSPGVKTVVAPPPLLFGLGRFSRWAASASAAASLTFVWSPLASAAPTVGIDLNAGATTGESDSENGGGFGLRAGEEWELLVLTLCPELSGQYARFGGPRDPAAYQLMAGGRLGIGFILEPSVYAHAGVGYLQQDVYDSGAGLAYDAGLALDLTLIPYMDIGVHAQLSGIGGNADMRGLGWGMVGLHVEFEAE